MMAAPSTMRNTAALYPRAGRKMPDYNYRALNPRGRLIKGAIEAASLRDLTLQLQNANIALIEAKLRKTPQSRFLAKRGDRFRDMAQFCRHISQLEQATSRITDTLHNAGLALPQGALKSSLTSVIREVDAGTSLSQSMSRRPDIFIEPMPALVAAAEATGRMGEVFG